MGKIKAPLTIGIILALILPTPVGAQMQAAPIVINEIAWMGTTASTNHEWIELYNTTDQNVDLTGWYIEDDDGAQTYALTGSVAAKSYFLIEDSEDSTSLQSNLITNLSLTNSGDKLVLKNSAGQIIDTVNSTSGAWYAGDNEAKTSMEKTDSESQGDIITNWGNNIQGNGALDSAGNPIKGTPKSLNSTDSENQPSDVSLTVNNATPRNGDTITASINVQNVKNLFAYGFDITYDSAVLQFAQTNKGNFLDEGNIATSFHWGLENGRAGRIIIGEARTLENKIGRSGSGALFTITFNVIGNAGSNSNIIITDKSFLATSEMDMLCRFTNTQVTVAQIQVVNPVRNLSAAEGINRYEMLLRWDAPVAGAESYKILRKNTQNEFAELGTIQNSSFTDNSNLIPNLEYTYKIIAKQGNDESEAILITQKDTRGIKGDNNRSDRVDGRDLEKLAKHFTEIFGNAKFDPLVDTTYDGIINGNDLIDIGVNWAVTYGN